MLLVDKQTWHLLTIERKNIYFYFLACQFYYYVSYMSDQTVTG